jgi:small-conductance mechanosensitive channel
VSLFESIKQITQHFSPTTLQFLISLLALGLYFVFSRRLLPVLYQLIAHSRLKDDMNKRAVVVMHILLVLVLIILLSVIWGLDIRGLLVLASSVIAIVGVALFASWSLLSNITAFFILLGHKAFSQGAEIRVVDGANFIDGRIVEINLFSTVLRTVNNELVVYPNNLIVSRPVVVLPNKSRKVTTQNKVVEKAQKWRRKVLINQKND